MTIARDKAGKVVGQAVFPEKTTGQDVCLLTKDGYIYMLRTAVTLEKVS